MVDVRAAKRYAAALFETARKHNVVANVESDMDAICALLDNQKFLHVILSPEVSHDEKLGLCERLFADRVTALTMQALRLILQKRREHEIFAIRDAFTDLRRESEGVVFARVASSEELTKAQKDEILARLRLTTGKKVEAEFDLDPHLIGGVKATFGNTVLDGSLRGGLAAMRDRLYHDLLIQP